MGTFLDFPDNPSRKSPSSGAAASFPGLNREIHMSDYTGPAAFQLRGREQSNDGDELARKIPRDFWVKKE